MDELRKLQAWYTSHCDGDWEHEFGIKVETLDNPGWSVKIDLSGTGLEHKKFEPLTRDLEDDIDWLHCKVESTRFVGCGGANNLTEILNIFLRWTELILSPPQHFYRTHC